MPKPYISVYDFGKQLLDAGDLDPVYVVVHEAGLSRSDLQRWLLAYWGFYHSGTASFIASAPDGDEGYWVRFETAARSKEFPRSSERRHFRGNNAINSVAFLKQNRVGPLFDDLLSTSCWSPLPPSLTAAVLMDRVTEWVGFGPWIAFKVADMIERLGIAPVKFDLDTVMYDSPREAAELLWDREKGPGEKAGAGAWAIWKILEKLGHYKAPPRYERNLNAQEAETILCKHKSYLGGHYTVGEDVEALREGLLRFARSSISQKLLTGGKKGGLW